MDVVTIKHSMSDTESIPDLYRPELNSANNSTFNHQFSSFFSAVNKEGLSHEQFITAVKAVFQSRGLSTSVQMSEQSWPAGFNEQTNSLTIHPAFFEICQVNQDCRLFGATEVFDRVIHAQLQHESDQGPTSQGISNTGGQELLALVQIKAAKQDAILKQQRGSESGKPHQDEQIIDPTSAWNIASPRFGSEARCSDAFEAALGAYFTK